MGTMFRHRKPIAAMAFREHVGKPLLFSTPSVISLDYLSLFNLPEARDLPSRDINHYGTPVRKSYVTEESRWMNVLTVFQLLHLPSSKQSFCKTAKYVD